MSLQFNISPPTKQLKLPSVKVSMVEETPSLSLTCFSSNIKLDFENVVGTSVTQQVLITNPSEQDITICVLNLPTAELGVTVNWHKQMIPSHDHRIFEVSWRPLSEGCWRHIFKLEDGHRLKKTISVAFKSIAVSKKTKITKKKMPVLLRKTTCSPKYKKSNPTFTKKYTCKENVEPSDETFLYSSSNNSLTIKGNNDAVRRETYNINCFTPLKENTMCKGLTDYNETFSVTYVQQQLESVSPEEQKLHANVSKDFSDDSLESHNTTQIVNLPTHFSLLSNRDSTPITRKNDGRSPCYYLSNNKALSSFQTTIQESPLEDYVSSTTIFKRKCEPSFDTSPAKKLQFNEQRTKPSQCGQFKTHVINTAPFLSSTPCYDRKSNRMFAEKYTSKENLQPDETFLYSTSNNSLTIKSNNDEFRRETYSINCFKPLAENSECKGRTDYNETFNATYVQRQLEAASCEEQKIDAYVSNDFHNTTQIVNLHKSSPPLSCGDSTPIKREKDGCSPCHYSSNKKGLSLFQTSIQESPFEDILSSTTKLKRKSNSIFDISPAKKLQFNEQTKPSHKWSKCGQFKTQVINPYLLTVDPFLSSTPYYDQKWMEEQEECFKKWLNCLLTPPAELHSNTEAEIIDAAKLWQECRNKPVEVPQTKEIVSALYHTNKRLDSLRISAKHMFNSDEIRTVLAKTNMIVDAEKLSIRADRNVHANIGLQTQIIRLLLCYNPLWLRLGLETIYNTTIPLSSNSDIYGLTHFIEQRFFKDPILLKKHKSVFTVKYVSSIKQFVLKQFLSLVYLLDVAKTKVLIPHDPCLFCKKAQYKESREILIVFACELLASVGDITRYLRRFGYIVVHEQKYIHEFDYSVVHLGSDLQDGVRLTKVMEIILVQTGLVEKLRVPAISLLQKVHNVEVVFAALKSANFEIVGDITPKNIVEGHREKTLSFLWQIIYKFQAPILIKAAVKIQSWWRSFPIIIKRRILNKPHVAAAKIQSYFKMCVLKRRYSKIKTATLVIQSFTRMIILKNNFIKTHAAVISIQQRYRAYKAMKVQRFEFLKLRMATIAIQRQFKLKRLEKAAITIQRRYRAQKSMKIDYDNFISIKAAAICIQRYFRAWKEVKFSKIRSCAIIIQRRFRANQAMKQQRSKYLSLNHAALVTQHRIRANFAMKTARLTYQTLRYAAIVVQQHFRANRAMKECRSSYENLKCASIAVQRRFRAKRAMQVQRSSFVLLQHCAITIQRRFRANQVMKQQRSKYLSLKRAVLVVQHRVRANFAMKTRSLNYQTLRLATIVIQQRFRANKAMKLQHSRYLSLKHASCVIQRRFRANHAMIQCCKSYENLKYATIAVQRRFRAKRAMQLQRSSFVLLQQYVITIQRRFRANQVMKQQRSKYLCLKRAALIVQHRIRANFAMKTISLKYQNLRRATIVIQQRFRANKTMKLQHSKYVSLKRASCIIQRRFRANRVMQECYNSYKSLKGATIALQRHFRAKRAMQLQRSNFVLLQHSTITIQRRFRANLLSRNTRITYQNIQNAVLVIQRRYKANKAMKQELARYTLLKQMTITIQRLFRANCKMQKCYQEYHATKSSAITIQRRFRLFQTMKKDQLQFVSLKQATIKLQRNYRSNKVMRPVHTEYNNLKHAAICIQRHFRSNRDMKIQSQKFTAIRKAAITIQRQFRKYRAVAAERQQFVTYRNRRRAAATKIQAYWRGYCARISHPETRRICKNLKELNCTALSQNTLGFRKEQALQLLGSANPSLLHIINALEDLDYITRRCKQMCLTLSQLLPDSLYETIKSGNRSLHDMQACAAATGILINFYKYPPTAKLAWIPKHIDNIFTILIHCCDKEDKLFLYLCTLVWLFAQNEEYRFVICNIPNFSLILSKIQSLCLRKQKMVEHTRKYNIASIFSPYCKLPLPNCSPDWGLEFPDRPRLFTNAVHALKCLINVLDCK